jgi:O-antigen ligase
VAGTSDIRTSNPHNEYFLTAVQLGLVGLAMLFIFGFSLWQSTISLTGENKAALEGLVLTIGIGCLFNSQLLDAGEGRFFVVLSGIILGSIAGDKSAPR